MSNSLSEHQSEVKRDISALEDCQTKTFKLLQKMACFANNQELPENVVDTMKELSEVLAKQNEVTGTLVFTINSQRQK